MRKRTFYQVHARGVDRRLACQQMAQHFADEEQKPYAVLLAGQAGYVVVEWREEDSALEALGLIERVEPMEEARARTETGQ